MTPEEKARQQIDSLLTAAGWLPIPLPPFSEQRWIIADIERRLSIAAEVEAVESTTLARSVRLRQAILECAYAGRL